MPSTTSTVVSVPLVCTPSRRTMTATSIRFVSKARDGFTPTRSNCTVPSVASVRASSVARAANRRSPPGQVAPSCSHTMGAGSHGPSNSTATRERAAGRCSSQQRTRRNRGRSPSGAAGGRTGLAASGNSGRSIDCPGGGGPNSKGTTTHIPASHPGVCDASPRSRFTRSPRLLPRARNGSTLRRSESAASS